MSQNLLQLRQIAFGGVYVANTQQLKSITNDSDNNKSVFRKILSWKIGVIDLPVYIVLAAIILTAAYFNKIPANMLGGFAVIMILGIFLGDVGQRIPILKDIGGPAILSLFVPSLWSFSCSESKLVGSGYVSDENVELPILLYICSCSR